MISLVVSLALSPGGSQGVNQCCAQCRMRAVAFQSPLGLVDLGIHGSHEGIGPAQVADGSTFEKGLPDFGQPRATKEVFSFRQGLGFAVAAFPFRADAAGWRALGRPFAGDHDDLAGVVVSTGMGGHLAVIPDEVAFAGPARTYPRRVIGQDGEVASEFPSSKPALPATIESI